MLCLDNTIILIESQGFVCKNYDTNLDGSRIAYEFPKENEGHHHEFNHAAECIKSGAVESEVMTLKESIRICELCGEIRKECKIWS